MRFGPIPVEQAEGEILGHNITGEDGRRRFRKGRRLTPEDIAELRSSGRSLVYVAQMDEGDIDEDEAARRIAEAVRGDGLSLSGPAQGRVNLRAADLGVLRVDPSRLMRLNALAGVTLATLHSDMAVRARQIVATVKIIPYALPDALVRQAEAAARDGGALLQVQPIPARKVGLILSGPEELEGSLWDQFAPLQERLESLRSSLDFVESVPVDEEIAETALAEALSRQRESGAALIVLAGLTAVMDQHDIAPRAIERAGGRVECVGAPVDPGNLLMLGYLDEVPVLGAPGCARSRKTNIIDWVLPRLLAGEKLAWVDIIALGHGGLLEDVPERPMPRSRVG